MDARWSRPATVRLARRLAAAVTDPATARGSRRAEHLHRGAGAARAEAGSRPRSGGGRRHRPSREADARLARQPPTTAPVETVANPKGRACVYRDTYANARAPGHARHDPRGHRSAAVHTGIARTAGGSEHTVRGGVG